MKRIFAGLLLTVLMACPGVSAGPVNVFVSIPPQAWLVKMIAGDSAVVHVMVPPGRDPHDYAPTPRQMALLARADLYFGIGLEFEKVWMGRLKAVNPRMQVVDQARNVHRIAMAGSRNKPGKSGLRDPHLWMDPRNMKIMAVTTYGVLVRKPGLSPAVLAERLDDVMKQLNRLDDEILKATSALENRTFMVFHPFMGYFARAYNLRMLTIESSGHEPGAKHLAGLISLAKKEKIKIIFVQPQKDRRNAMAVAQAAGAVVLTLDPLLEDYAANMHDIAVKMKKAMALR